MPKPLHLPFPLICTHRPNFLEEANSPMGVGKKSPVWDTAALAGAEVSGAPSPTGCGFLATIRTGHINIGRVRESRRVRESCTARILHPFPQSQSRLGRGYPPCTRPHFQGFRGCLAPNRPPQSHTYILTHTPPHTHNTHTHTHMQARTQARQRTPTRSCAQTHACTHLHTHKHVKHANVCGLRIGIP